MIKEVWKDIPDYEGLYRVSNKGNVKSLYMWDGSEYKNRERPYTLAQSLTTTGYKKVELVKNKNKKSLKVHRLVGLAFIDNPDDKPHINHIDGNPINNKVENLEWCTQRENVRHAIKTGLRKYPRDHIDHDAVIKEYKNNKNTREICDKFKITEAILYGILEKHGVDRRSISEAKDQYNIDLDELLEDFKKGKRNVDLAKKYNCPRGLIGVRKYKFKKEGLL